MPQNPSGGWVDASQVKPWTPQTGGWVNATDVQSASTPEPDSGGVSGFAREFWKRTNPVETIKGLVHAAGDVPGTVKHLITADPEFLDQAHQAAKDGDYLTATRKVLSYLSMGLGHELDTQSDLLAKGQYAEGAGAMAGTAANLVVPGELAKAASGLRVPGVAANADPAVVRAVEVGKAAGVPIDAATATGNPFVKFAQKTADESLLGSVVGGRARAAQQQGLATMGEQIAAKAHPVAVTADTAGEAAQVGTRGSVSTQRAAANAAYDKLRTIEAATPMPVDLTGVKAAVKPIMARLVAKKGVTGALMGAEATAADRINALLEAPDAAPLSVADAALSDLKRLARSNNPDLRTVGQGIAAKAVTELHQAVDAAAATVPDAATALAEGRQATIAKYAAADVLKRVEGAQGTKSPVTAFRGMTQAGDASIDHLRDVLKQAPHTKPLVARAVLDGVIDSPTVTPGRALTDWQKLGPETKALLYNPSHVQAIDDFLLLRKKIAENPNPSGSGLSVLKGGELYLRDPGLTVSLPLVSALLHSETGVRLLTQGFRLPLLSPVAKGAWLAGVTKAADAAGVPLTLPAPAYAGQPRQ